MTAGLTVQELAASGGALCVNPAREIMVLICRMWRPQPCFRHAWLQPNKQGGGSGEGGGGLEAERSLSLFEKTGPHNKASS